MSSFQDTSSSPVDIDDNAFYEELTRQILMLTDEDDHDDKVTYTNGVMDIWRKPMVYGGVGPRPVARNYYSWSETGRSSVPSWMENLWAANGGGGTGVFIPNGVTTRGHGKRSGRRRHHNNNKATKNSDRGRVYSAVGQKIHG